MILSLPHDIVKNTLSDYIEYDDLNILISKNLGFHLNHKRVKIIDTNEGKHT